MTDSQERTSERRSEHRSDTLNALDRQIRALKDEFERLREFEWVYKDLCK
jgi:hypothetical protein